MQQTNHRFEEFPRLLQVPEPMVWVLAGLLTTFIAQADPPPNDSFNHRLTLTPGVLVQGSLDEATPDVERPDLVPGFRPSVWFRWTPELDGQWTLRVRGARAGTMLEVFTGNTLADLVGVPGPGTLDPVLDVKAGRSYAVALAGDAGPYELQNRFDPLAAADAFGDRPMLTGEHVERRAGWRAATLEPGESLSSNFGSLWWSWIAPADGMLVTRVSDDPPGFQNAYTLNALLGDDLRQLTMAPREPYFGQRVQAGRAYALLLLVDSMAFGAQGKDYVATLDLWPIEPNENFANRSLLSGESVQFSGDDHVSWLEDGEPVNGLATSLWWEWTPPFSGAVEFHWEGGDPGGAIRFYGENPFGPAGAIPFPPNGAVVQAGRPYYLCMGSPLVGGGQAQAVRGRRTWSLRLVPEIEPLRFKAEYYSPSTGLLLSLTGQYGAKVEVFYSTDCVHWSSLSKLMLDAPKMNLWDYVAVENSMRFYKAVILP